MAVPFLTSPPQTSRAYDENAGREKHFEYTQSTLPGAGHLRGQKTNRQASGLLWALPAACCHVQNQVQQLPQLRWASLKIGTHPGPSGTNHSRPTFICQLIVAACQNYEQPISGSHGASLTPLPVKVRKRIQNSPPDRANLPRCCDTSMADCL